MCSYCGQTAASGRPRGHPNNGRLPFDENAGILPAHRIALHLTDRVGEANLSTGALLMNTDGVDKELAAMSAIATALNGFMAEDREALNRILTWMNAKYGGRPFPAPSTASQAPSLAAPQASSTSTREWSDAAELYDAAQPSLEFEKAVVGGYWIQVCQAKGEFTSQDVNSILKNMGHGVANITDAFSTAMARKPSLVLQTQKSGQSRQARKTFRLTTAGLKFVEQRALNGSPDASPTED